MPEQLRLQVIESSFDLRQEGSYGVVQRRRVYEQVIAYDQYFFLVTMAQKSSKVNSQLVSVWLRMWVLCIISMISSWLMVSPSSVQTRLIFSRSMAPVCSRSQRWNTLSSPSLERVSPSLAQMTSRKSSQVMDLPLACSSLIMWKTDSLRLSSPSSCRIFWISLGSIVPVPSQSKRSKVDLSSSRSCCESFSRAGTTAGLLGVFVRIQIYYTQRQNAQTYQSKMQMFVSTKDIQHQSFKCTISSALSERSEQARVGRGKTFKYHFYWGISLLLGYLCSMVQKRRKAMVLVSGFLISLGASPRKASPVLARICSCLAIPIPPNSFCVMMQLCSSALTISRGWVSVVLRTPEIIPARKECIPSFFPYWQSVQQSPANSPSLQQLVRPPFHSPPRPSTWYILKRFLRMPPLQRSLPPYSYLVQSTERGLEASVLAMRAQSELRKVAIVGFRGELCFAVRRSQRRRKEKQMEELKPVRTRLGTSPRQKARLPSLRRQLMEMRILQMKLRESVTSLGGTSIIIFTFSMGCRTAAVMHPERQPNIPCFYILHSYCLNQLYAAYNKKQG